VADVSCTAHLLANKKQAQVIMEQVKAFKTSDGTLFDTAEQAEKHEMFLKHSNVVEEFLDSELSPYSGPQRVIARNSIINWELWKTKNGNQ